METNNKKDYTTPAIEVINLEETPKLLAYSIPPTQDNTGGE
jgi:hypothetical protein